MSDAALRELERQARAGDTSARRRWRAGLLRLRDPRQAPQPGDVIRVAGLSRLVRRVNTHPTIAYPSGRPIEEVTIVWHKVLWLYGEEQGAGLCYRFRPMLCSLAHWRRWARKGEVVRLAEEREPADQDDVPETEV